MAASVAILPPAPLGSSPHEHGFEPAALFASTISESSLRPKLSLNTSIPQKPVSKSNTALRLDTLSAISPTIRNTYKNTYEGHDVPATPFEALDSSQSTRSTSLNPPARHTSHAPRESLASPGSNIPTTSESTSSSFPQDLSSPRTPSIPYNVSIELSSILRNGPFSQRNAQDGPTASNHKHAKSKPSKVRVAFRQPLVEEITTSRYTAAHSDLMDFEPLPTTSSGSVVAPCAGKKRDSPSDEEDASDEGRDDEGSFLKTPVAGRRQRKRTWMWTLSPVPSPSDGNGEVKNGLERVAEDGL